jgi:hypothetical protein
MTTKQAFLGKLVMCLRGVKMGMNAGEYNGMVPVLMNSWTC